MSSQEIDPPKTAQVIPEWLRNQFCHIESHVGHMGAQAVFTQMRTKVQAYFEMCCSVERVKAGRDQAVIIQQKSLIESLREDLNTAIAIDCQDDAIEACLEVERIGAPGSVIREMNDELVDLRGDAERFRFIAQDAGSGLARIYGDDWLSAVDRLRGAGDDNE